MSVLLINIRQQGENERITKLREEETESLLKTLSLSVALSVTYTLREINTSLYIGPGQAENALECIRASEADEAVFNAFISPRQEKNLERLLGVPVSDREAVILSIFFQNAHSREARLQIAKAEAMYLKPRLQNREANLSQQRGGVRGAKGEGERKIELERRLIDQRIRSLDREISSVEEIRKTQRKERSKSGIFSFALTGYTNAGKSTILNALTDARVLAEDKLFATLDTTTRSLSLPNGQKVLLSDTVGFIADLPEVLIKAFSSTLEEALSANAIIIVADASHPDAYGCLRKTKETLAELGAIDKVKILVINKTDDIYDEIAYASLLREPYKIVETSMKEGKGIEKLLSAMADVTDEEYTTLTVSAPISSDIISSLSKDGTIRNIVYSEESVRVTVRIRKELARKYKELK